MAGLASQIQGPIAVIGDVHGQVDQLITILDRLRRLPDYESRWIVFIGDLVDRGPDPKGALDVVCDLLLEHPRTTVICGNHELAMAGSLGLIPTPDYSTWGERWLADYSAETTFDSFGVPFGDFAGLRARLSERHVELLSDLPWLVEHRDFLFVHAGLDPNTPFEMQKRILRQRDYSLNRPQWLCSKSFPTAPIPPDCPVTVVTGHVEVPAVEHGNKKLRIDTTGGHGGDLSCVLLPEMKIISSGQNAPSHAAAAGKSGKSWWKLW
jgi:serine/threonine protein phosphatase 1